MSNLASDSFTGTDGSSWSSTWTTGSTPTGGTAVLASNAGRLTTGTAGGYAGASRIARRVNITAPTDAVALFKFRWPTGDENYPRFYIRSTNTTLDAQGGYWIELTAHASQWNVGYGQSYSNTDLGSAVSFTFASNTWYWCRFGIVGTAVKARVWADGSPEPSTWDVALTDSTITSAGSGCGFSLGPGNAGNAKFEVDDFSLDSAFPLQSLSLSGSGSLTVLGTPKPTGSTALSGSGTLAASGKLGYSATSALSGSGSLSLAGTPKPVVALALSGLGSLTLAATAAVLASVSTSGSGSLTQVGSPGFDDEIDSSSAGTLTVSGTSGSAAEANLSGSGLLTLSGKPEPKAQEPFSGLGLLAPTSVVGLHGIDAQNGSGDLSVALLPGLAGLCIGSGSGTLSASGIAVISELPTLGYVIKARRTPGGPRIGKRNYG